MMWLGLIQVLSTPLLDFTSDINVMLSSLWSLVAAASDPVALSVSVTDIQGPAFQSPLAGHTVQNLIGLVTAKVFKHSYFYTLTPPNLSK